MSVTSACGIGSAVQRVEDDTLLAGRGVFADDLGVAPGTLHMAILRSPHAHARIDRLETAKAKAVPGVRTVLGGNDLAKASAPLMAVLRTPMTVRPCAVDRTRYVGEPIAIALSKDRYLAEDAIDLIEVNYSPLPAVMDPLQAMTDDAPLLHEGLDHNLVSDRSFTYGRPDEAFSEAAHIVETQITYPRNSCTPLEGYVVHASYDPGKDAFTVRSNFQGPFSLHPVMARSLGVSENRLRLISVPNSGGSFGIKQAIYPMIVLTALAAKLTGSPVSWVEDRLEHLTGASSATNRATSIKAAVQKDGRILALDWDQVDDVGAYLRAPEPASLYRMHGNLAGAYDIQNVKCRNRVVVTNKTPTGLNRGFGGPQHYFALERLVHQIAIELDLDRIDVIKQNLVPAKRFPYKSASGAVLDSGNYEALVEKVLTPQVISDLEARKQKSISSGKLYGIGFAAVVEPSISNMGYITTALTPAQRAKAGSKGGAIASSTVSIDPTGSVSVTCDSVPQGQGHETVLIQVVSEVLGVSPEFIQVNGELDTQKDAWSIAAGNYSSRFAGAVAGSAALAAERLRERLAQIAASSLNVPPHAVEFVDGNARAVGNPENVVSFQRLAGAAHWSPGSLPSHLQRGLTETAQWSPDELTPPNEADEINSSLAYGFVFDVCGLEIDPNSGATRIDRYITGHDAGRLLNPLLADGQIYGAFAHAVGASLLEELAYDDDGNFLSGTLADYLLPTTCEVARPEIIHLETPSPFTPLGAKGLGEGNCMSTPVAIANAAADALGYQDVQLPLTRSRMFEMISRGAGETPPREGSKKQEPYPRAKDGKKGRSVEGHGKTTLSIGPEAAWTMLLNPQTLGAVIPGCRSIYARTPECFVGTVRIGVGAVRGDFDFEVHLTDMHPPNSILLSGAGQGALGAGSGEGVLTLEDDSAGGSTLTYRFSVDVNGKVAAVGGRMLDSVARMLASEFFDALAAEISGAPKRRLSFLQRLLRMIGLKK